MPLTNSARISSSILLGVMVQAMPVPAAEITWSSGTATDDTAVSNHGTRLEAANFGNANTTSPTVNGVPFQAIDFTADGTPTHLVGLTYNTGEHGKFSGTGVAELFDTIAYHSGVDPQTATLTALSPGAIYEVQFFYFHNNVDRSVTISDDHSNTVTLTETGTPLFATGTFTADADTQRLAFDANTGSQFLNAYQIREIDRDLPAVADTKFDPDRGHYDTPLHVKITTATGDATVRYTTDGSLPTPDNGLDYPGGDGIPIGRTTIIRAAAFKDGFKPTDVDTHTYLFVNDVVDQPSNPPGFPTTWTGADYAMENHPAHLPLVAGDPSLSPADAKQLIAAALRDLPTLSLTMPVDDWFSPSSGIYHNTEGRGTAWERPCSAEYFFAGETPPEPGFQIDCGVRLQGFTSRDPNRNPKHSLRLVFRGSYGATKLRYPLFGDGAPSSFDTLVLRSNSQDAWVYNTTANRAAQFVRDHWNRRVMQLMGQPAPHSNWVHLYLNGLYWGVYNPTERPDAAFGATVHGGDKADFDAVKNHEEVIDGTPDAFRDLLALIQNDPGNFDAGYRDLSAPDNYAAALPFIETTNLVDYMIHNMYAAAQDWPGNFYMGYDRTGAAGGWWFYDWDNEHGLKGSVSENRTRPHRRDGDSPTKFHHALRANPEYRLLFADRLHRAFFDGGPLAVDPGNPAWDPDHPERNRPAALWMELTTEIETALIAESARWGDYRRATPYTVARDFTTLRDSLLRTWFPRRSAIVLDQFRAMGLYPDTPAPTFDLPDGNVPSGTRLTITSPPGSTVHFTTDGTDPRTSPTAATYTGPVTLDTSGQLKARTLQAGEWSALARRSFIVGTPASADNLAVSEIMYHATEGPAHDFIELTNISTTDTIDLTGVSFTDGITFDFPTATTIGPGAHLVIAKTPSLYPGSIGPYTGNLDNAGETITLTSHTGATIRSLRYNDRSPWPIAPDGAGPSLVLVAPATNPDHNLPQNWRPSTASGGNPNTTDTVLFEPETTDILTYALGQDPVLTVTPDLYLTFTQTPAADAATITPQWSTDLSDWSTSDFAYTAPHTYRFSPPHPHLPTLHFRIQVKLRP